MKRRFLMHAGAACLLLLLGGCTARNLIFTTYTTVGLDIAGTDAKPTKAVFGYKRFEGAIIPVEQKAVDQDVMSVYAGIDVRNHWWNGLDVFQVFATGTPAVNAIKHPEKINKLIRELRGTATATPTATPTS